MNLKEWTIAYVKNKDLSQRKLVKIEDKKDFLELHYKDKTVINYISTKLDDTLIKKIESLDQKAITCLNTEDNFKFLIKNWEKLIKIKNLNILFVNDKFIDKWLINPYLHSLVADPDTIEQGLRTMYDTANGKVTEVPKGKKKSSMFEESSSNEEDEESEEEN